MNNIYFSAGNRSFKNLERAVNYCITNDFSLELIEVKRKGKIKTTKECY